MGALATAVAIGPTQALLGEARGFGFAADMISGGGAMGFAEGMTASDEGDGLFVVHRHPRKRFADVAGRAKGIGVTVRALRINVDQPHLHRGQGLLKVAITAIALIA